jgi:hypothetical protein
MYSFYFHPFILSYFIYLNTYLQCVVSPRCTLTLTLTLTLTYLQCVVCPRCTLAPLEVSEEVPEDKFLVARLDAGVERVDTAGNPERRGRLTGV